MKHETSKGKLELESSQQSITPSTLESATKDYLQRNIAKLAQYLKEAKAKVEPSVREPIPFNPVCEEAARNLLNYCQQHLNYYTPPADIKSYLSKTFTQSEYDDNEFFDIYRSIVLECKALIKLADQLDSQQFCESIAQEYKYTIIESREGMMYRWNKQMHVSKPTVLPAAPIPTAPKEEMTAEVPQPSAPPAPPPPYNPEYIAAKRKPASSAVVSTSIFAKVSGGKKRIPIKDNDLRPDCVPITFIK